MWEEFKKKKEIRDKKEKAIRDAFIVIFVVFLCMIEIWGERKRMIEFYMEYRRKRGQDILPDGYSIEDLEDDNKLKEIEEICQKELEHQGVIKW